MTSFRPKLWTGVSAAVLISTGALVACSPQPRAPKASAESPPTPAVVTSAAALAGAGEAGETGAVSAYSAISADSVNALHIAHLRGFVLVAMAQKDGPEAAAILVAQGMLEAYEKSPQPFKAAGIDEALLRKAADTGASGDLKAALSALDAGLAKAGGDRKAVIRGLLEISSGLYKGVVIDGGVDPIEYQHSLGAALSARAALTDAAKSDPSLAAAKPEMDRFVALWPTPSAPEKPAAHGALLAQASRLELALS
jgi:hypothetical protein